MKVTGQNFLYEWEALVTRNLQAKYEGSISNGSKVKTNVKVVQPTNKPTNRQGKNNMSRCRYRDIKNHGVCLYLFEHITLNMSGQFMGCKDTK